MKKRVFSPEFKDEAVHLVREQSVSVRQAAEDLRYWAKHASEMAEASTGPQGD